MLFFQLNHSNNVSSLFGIIMPSLKIRISLGIKDMKPPKTTGMLGFNNGDQRLTVRHSIAHIRYCVSSLFPFYPRFYTRCLCWTIRVFTGVEITISINFRFICLCLFLITPMFHAQSHLFPRVFPGFPTFFSRRSVTTPNRSKNLGRRAGRCKMATTAMLRAMTLMSPAWRWRRKTDVCCTFWNHTLWWTYKKQWKMAIYSGFSH